MVIFHSYVSLPEGMSFIAINQKLVEKILHFQRPHMGNLRQDPGMGNALKKALPMDVDSPTYCPQIFIHRNRQSPDWATPRNS